MKYFRKSDAIFTVVILLIEVVLIFLYFSIGALMLSNRRKIATVTFKNNIATRRQADVFHWQNLSNGSTLYEFDTLHTAEKSGATIYFTDGAELEVSDNSLIRLGGINDGQLANIDNGNLTVSNTADKSKTISIKGKSVTLSEDATIVIKTAESGETQLEVQSGTATIADGNQVAELNQLQAITINNDQTLDEVKTLQGLPAQPTDKKHFLIVDGNVAKIPFEFTAADANNVTLIIAEDAAFNNVISTVNNFEAGTGKNMYHCDVAVPAKKLYWKLRFNDGTESDTKSLVVEKAPSSSELKQSAVASVTQADGTYNIKFSWNKVEQANAYLFEFSKTPDFKNSITKKIIGNTFTQVSDVEEGDYYWRFVPQYACEVVGTKESAVHKITVSKAQKLIAVKTIFPANNYTLKLDSLKTNDLHFSWQPNALAKKYVLKFYDESKNLKESFTVNENTVSLQKLNSKMFQTTGKMFWSVSYKTADEENAPESVIVSLQKSNAITGFRSIFPKNNYVISKILMQNIRFTWENKTGYETLFTIARDENFKDVALEKKINGTSFLGAYLQNGDFFWRVQLINDRGSVEATSEVQKFTVISNLAAADITKPKDNDIIPRVKGAIAQLTWNPVAYADYYNVAVYDANGTRIMHEPFASGKAIQIPVKEYAEGTFTATVQAMSYDTVAHTQNIGLLSTIKFRSKEIEFLQLISPNDKAKIRGEEALDNGIIFKWKTDPVVGTAVFQLKKDGRIIKTIPSTKTGEVKLVLNDLGEGKYSWQVLGEFMGYEISSKQTNTFTILPIKPLKTPEFTMTNMPKIIGVDYLAKNRSLNFEWSPVEDADYYFFTVKNQNGTVIFVEKIEGTSFDFTKLNILSNGTFKAGVQAVSTIKIKNRTLKSETGYYSFTIDLPLITKPLNTVNKDAKYYGY